MIRIYPKSKYALSLLSKRKSRELTHWESWLSRGKLHLEHSEPTSKLISIFLKILGLKKRGLRNALDLRVIELELPLSRLPKVFHNFRMVFLSDLHLDCLAGLTEKLGEVLRGIKADICLIGGDYRSLISGPTKGVYLHMSKLLKDLDFPLGVVGIMGNHDFMEEAHEFEKMGMRVLVNQALEISRNGQSLWIVGLDDVHYYDCADLEGAMESVPKEDCKVLMVHSPELLDHAWGQKVDLYLAGHTHAGQIRLPFLGAIIVNAKCPRSFTWGLWRYLDMWGYTSSGAGVTLSPVRFNCPPEVVVFTLKTV